MTENQTNMAADLKEFEAKIIKIERLKIGEELKSIMLKVQDNKIIMQGLINMQIDISFLLIKLYNNLDLAPQILFDQGKHIEKSKLLIYLNDLSMINGSSSKKNLLTHISNFIFDAK